MKHLYTTIIAFLLVTLSIHAQQEHLILSSGEVIKPTTIKAKDKTHFKKKAEAFDFENTNTNQRGNTSYEAGTTNAAFSVSSTGGGTYTIPIATPPGIKDIAPNVSLAFNTQTNNGLAGWGWNIAGLSTISRVSTTTYFDECVEGVDFSPNDRFSLDGQRLLLKNGTYGANGSEYVTERYSNIKIRAIGVSSYGANYGPSYFIVNYPDGSMSWFGPSHNSRGRLEWAIWKKQDPQGNTIRYRYINDINLVTIDKITFGGNGSSSTSEIKFNYRTRQRQEIAYVNNIGFRRTKILDNIEVKGGGQLYRKYQLTHDQTSLEYERLISVQEFNSDNEGLKPIDFTYENSTNSDDLLFDGEMTIHPGYNFETDAVIPGRFNYDDKMDFIMYNTDTRNQIHIFDELYSNSNGGNTEVGSTYSVPHFDELIPNNMLNHQDKLLSQQGITFIKENLIGSGSTVNFRSYYHGAAGLYYHYTKTWNAPVNNYASSCTVSTKKKIDKEYVSGDFNGDGLTDVLAIGKPHNVRYCRYNDCGGDDDGDGDIPDQIPLQQPEESNEDYINRKVEYEKAVERGPDSDDIIDIKQDDNRCCQCYSYNYSYRGTYFIDLNRNLTSNYVNYSGGLIRPLEDEDRLRVADFNGDGKSDLFHFKDGEVFVYELNCDNRLVLIEHLQDSNINLNYPILLGDYNGDGKTDFVLPTGSNSNNWRFYISKGKDFRVGNKNIAPIYYRQDFTDYGAYDNNGQTVWRMSLFEFRYIPYDYNSDGKTDILIHQIKTPLEQVDPNEHFDTEVITAFGNMYDNSTSDYLPKFEIKGERIAQNTGIYRRGQSLFLDTNNNNGNSEYAYVSLNHIATYQFTKDHRKDITLRQISNNGITHQIDYKPLNSEDDTDHENVYAGDYSEVYPYININIAPSVKLIDEVREIGSGMTRYQNYKYSGAVSHAHGLGFIGFKQVKKTNWFGSGVQTQWSISDFDTQKRGAVTQSWTSLNAIDIPTSNLINKVNYTYNTTITPEKVFINTPTTITTEDFLTGAIKTESYTYDSFYNPETITTNLPSLSRTVNYTYSNNTVPIGVWYHVGRVTNKTETSVINGNSFTTQESYGYSNNLMNLKRNKSNNSNWINEYYTYDGFGNIIQKRLSATGIADRTEYFEYDPTGRYLTKSTDIEGLETTFTYNTSNGNPLTTTSPYGLTTSYQYDAWNRLIKETDYLGKETNFYYQNVNTFGTGSLLKITDIDQGQDTKTYYNSFGWVGKESVLSLNNKWISKDVEFDAAGRSIRESEPYFSTASPTQWNQTAYDQYGRPITQQLYTGKVITTDYNGLTVTVDDGTKTITKTVDALGNTTSITDPGGIIDYQYYGNGALKTANYDSHTISITVDDWGRKTAMYDPSAGNYTYAYDELGNIINETTPKGETTYEYDDFGKLIYKAQEGDNTEMFVDYTYDPTSKLLTSVHAVDDNFNKNYDYTYTYDSYYRPSSITETRGSDNFQRTMTYDDYGRIDTETYITNTSAVSNQVKVKNGYDTAGILKNILDFNTNSLLWNVGSENSRGQLLTASLGNGYISTREYDEYGMLTKIYDRKLPLHGPLDPFPPDPIVALEMDYSFNAERGILNSRTNGGFNWDETFTHDNLDRLTNISGPNPHNIQYDARGRITTNQHLGDYTYDVNSTYRLDEIELNDQGDLYYQQNSLQQIIYNAFKKPVEIYEKEKGRVSFEYDHDNNRTYAFYGGLETDKTQRQYQKLYSSIMPVEVVTDQVNNTSKVITYVGGDAYTAAIAHIKTIGTANDLDEYHYLHRDYLGSILAISNSNLDIVEQRQFSAWGLADKFIDSSGNTSFNHSSLINRGFTGHEHFFSVSLIHMNGRMYDAKLGRFLSPDNYIQDPYNTQNFNRYSYVWNNPLVLNDPTGELVWWASAVIGAAISVIVNGISNSIHGQGFFEGGFRAAWVGAITGIGAAGIGSAVSGLTGVMKVAVQTLAHGHLGMMSASFYGSNLGAGFTSGALGSLMAAGVGEIIGNSTSSFTRATVMIATGGLSGGVGSSIAGGNFWEGVRNGLISSTLNHVAHNVERYLSSKAKIIAGIYGAGGKNAGDNPTLEKLVLSKGGKMFSSSWPWGNGDDEIISYLLNGHEEGKLIEIYGYSRGGNAAIRITNKLGEMGINVHKLITYDPHFFGNTNSVFKLKYDNVSYVRNYFQKNNWIMFQKNNPFWGNAVISTFDNINLLNFDLTGVKNVTHLNIIEYVLSKR